ncbi:hypothetical protein VTI74DRAFT_379 [Chaetomium olivicolor]
MEEQETGPQLIRMTTEDMIHLVLPINPEVAVIFCDESRCWESPFADAMHRTKIPYPANSLLKDAPHKDIINVDIPSQRRGKKTWPATVAWRSFLVVRRRARFERAKRELAEFQRGRAEAWKRQGIRFGHPVDRPCQQRERAAGLSQEQIMTTVENHTSALLDILNLVNTSRERIPRSKENSIKCWRAFLTLDQISSADPTLPSKSDDTSSPKRIMHPALKTAFEAAYPPKHPEHRDLIEVDFAEFVYHCMGEEKFAQLSVAIDEKIHELVYKDGFEAYFEDTQQANRGFQPAATSLFQQRDSAGEEKDVLGNPCFRSFFRAAQGFDVLRWMFEERQDILATFVRQIAVPMAEMQPYVLRSRARRE